MWIVINNNNLRMRRFNSRIKAVHAVNKLTDGTLKKDGVVIYHTNFKRHKPKQGGKEDEN